MTAVRLAADAIGFVGIGTISAAAFSSPALSSLVARPLGPPTSIAVDSNARFRSPLGPLSRDDGRYTTPSHQSHSATATILGSSLVETVETESANNETLGSLPVLEGGAADASIASGVNVNLVDNDIPPLPLPQIFSSSVVLDTAAALDLDDSMSVTEDIVDEVLDSTAVEAATTAATPMATFQQDDSELTLPVMAKYAKPTSSDGVAVVGVSDQDSPHLLEIADNLVQKSESIGSKLDSDLLGPKPTEKSILDRVPSVQTILRYTIPAIGIWLCSPVLSMIDTASVGLLSGTAQQAALNPAVSVTDQGALLVAFMYTATTNLIAAAMQKDVENADGDGASSIARPRTAATLATALKLALVVGIVFGAILGTSGDALLRLLIGNDALDPVVFGAARRYVRIRALGMPAAVVIGTAQSACLGMQDVKSPLYVLAAAAVVNFLGDVLLVPRASPLFGGAAGAAWATVASQWAALLFFGRWLTTKGGSAGRDESAANADSSRDKKGGGSNNEEANVFNITQSIMDLTGTSTKGSSRRKRFRDLLDSSKLTRRIRLASKSKSLESRQAPIPKDATVTSNSRIRPKRRPPRSRGFLSNGELTLRKYLSLSNIDGTTARKFLPFVVPVTTTSIGRISGYVAMSHLASSTLGTRDMAAHQIIFSIFCCLCPFVDALGQVAQSLVPALFEAKERSPERAAALRSTVGNFRAVGLGFGAVLLFLVSRVQIMSSWFTADPLVLESVNGAIPGMGLFLLLHGLVCGGEGLLLGQKDLKFLRNSYAVFFFAVPACMMRLKYRALAGVQAVGVGTMWGAFSIYQVIRTSLWHLRLAQLQRRTEREVAVISR